MGAFVHLMLIGLVLASTSGFVIQENDGLAKGPSTKGVRYVLLNSLLKVAQAHTACHNLNGKLVAIETDEQDLNMVIEVGGRITNPAWTSGRRNQTCDPWVWTSTGNQLGSYNTEHWSDDVEKGQIGCIYYDRHQEKGLSWFVGDCEDRKLVICEIPTSD